MLWAGSLVCNASDNLGVSHDPKKLLTSVSKKVPGAHGKEELGEGLAEKVGKGLVKGWLKVGEGLAKGWQRVSLHPQEWVRDSMDRFRRIASLQNPLLYFRPFLALNDPKSFHPLQGHNTQIREKRVLGSKIETPFPPFRKRTF